MKKLIYTFITLLALITIPTFSFSQNVNVNATGGTAFATYPTLKAAFDAINAGTHTGVLNLTVIGSTTETATASLNGSGTGSANYTSVNILPTLNATVSGTFDGPLVNLNGAKNITVDGRIGGTGSTRSLTFRNAFISTGSTMSVSTLRFINDASNNTVRFCKIEGSTNHDTLATVRIAGTTGITGNKNISLLNNEIAPAGLDLPKIAIYSKGESATLTNSVNVTNNNIFDFFSTTITVGVELDVNNSDWSITGNSFYQTTTRTTTVNTTIVCIDINSGNGHNVSSNIIGGSAMNAGGTPLTIAGAFQNYFIGIFLNIGAANTVNVNGNVIENINHSTTIGASGVLSFNGIRSTTGNVNIGTITPNRIGSLTGTGSIVINANITAAGSSFVEPIILGGGTMDVRNNNIGSFTLNNTGAGTGQITFRGIETSGLAGATFMNNTIGGSTASSIQSSGTNSSLIGIINFNSVDNSTYTISNNTIRNFTNPSGGTVATITGIQQQITTSNTTITSIIENNNINNLATTSASSTSGAINGISNTVSGSLTNTTSNSSINGNNINNLIAASTGTGSTIRGISSGVGFTTANVMNNIIHTFTSPTTSTSATSVGAVQGIASSTSTGNTGSAMTISGNSIWNLECTGTAASFVMGIGFFQGSTTVVNIQKNTIYNLRNPNAAATGVTSGITGRGSSSLGTWTISNNFIALSGANTQVYGIHNNAVAAQINAYFNTIHISGTGAGANNSAAFFRNAVATAVDLRSNIFYNIRTGGGSNFAVSNTNATPATGWTLSNYNDLYSSTSSTIALWGAASQDFNTYKTSSSQDANSKSFVVNFVNPAMGDLHITGASNGDVNLRGFPVPGITDDIDNQLRSASEPYMGADEASITLPVKIIVFAGKVAGEDAMLNWSTSTEVNNRGFEMQKSLDGSDFTTIGFVAGAGNSNNVNNYQFTDRKIALGNHFYRLKQLDNDGRVEYSSIVKLNKTAKTNFEVIVINPSKDKVILQINSETAERVSINLYTMNGQLVANKITEISAGSNSFSIGNGLSKGAYILSINKNGEMSSYRVIIN